MFLGALQTVASAFSGGCAGGCCWAEPRRRNPSDEPPPPPPQLKWYRVHPSGDAMQCQVRPAAGRRGREQRFSKTLASSLSRDAKTPGDVHSIQARSQAATAAGLSRSKSLPREIERRLSLPEPQGMEVDAFRNTCRICFERPCQVVTMPCKHFFMCESCLRRHIFSRPVHKGARDCPLCRRYIREVIYVYSGAAIPQYGFAIRT